MDTSHRPSGATFHNAILTALPPDEIEHLRSQLTPVTLVSGQVLQERDSLIEDVFFMEAGITSTTADTMDNGAVEVGFTGREGLVGAVILLNPEALVVHRAFIQVPGAAFRMRAAALRQAAEGHLPSATAVYVTCISAWCRRRNSRLVTPATSCPSDWRVGY